MNPTLTPTGSSDCRAIGELLPWYANGTLNDSDRFLVDTHLAKCAACSAALAVDRQIIAAMRAPRNNVEQSPHASWQKLVARLEAQDVVTALENAIGGSSAPETAPSPPPARKANWSAALIAAVAMQAAAIAVLAVALVHYRQAEQAPRFHTLSHADPTLAASGSLVRIAFDPSVDEAMVQRMAAQAGGRILAGPSAENVYTFVFVDPAHDSGALAAHDLESKVSWLRHQDHVLLVEPVVLGSRNPSR